MKNYAQNFGIKRMALLLMCFASLSIATSCSHRPAPGIDIAPALLERTGTPTKPRGDYMQDAAAEYVLGLKRAIAACNADKDTIAKIMKP